MKKIIIVLAFLIALPAFTSGCAKKEEPKPYANLSPDAPRWVSWRDYNLSLGIDESTVYNVLSKDKKQNWVGMVKEFEIQNQEPTGRMKISISPTTTIIRDSKEVEIYTHERFMLFPGRKIQPNYLSLEEFFFE